MIAAEATSDTQSLGGEEIESTAGHTMSRRPRLTIATLIVLVATADLLVWANLRVSGDALSFNEVAPPELDPVTRFFFFRGWPLSPWKFCLIHGLRFRAESSPIRLILVLDLVVAGSVLLGVTFLCNWLVRCQRRDRPDLALQRTRPAATLSEIIKAVLGRPVR